MSKIKGKKITKSIIPIKNTENQKNNIKTKRQNTEPSHEYESQNRHKERKKKRFLDEKHAKKAKPSKKATFGTEKSAENNESPASFHSAELERLKANLRREAKNGIFDSGVEDDCSTEISSSDGERVVSGSEAGEILELDD